MKIGASGSNFGEDLPGLGHNGQGLPKSVSPPTLHPLTEVLVRLPTATGNSANDRYSARSNPPDAAKHRGTNTDLAEMQHHAPGNIPANVSMHMAPSTTHNRTRPRSMKVLLPRPQNNSTTSERGPSKAPRSGGVLFARRQHSACRMC